MSEAIQPPWVTAVSTYVAFTLLFVLGRLRDFVRQRVNFTGKKETAGYAPIRQDYEDFYTRRLYYRIHDCWNRPIASAPNNHVQVMERCPPKGQAALSFTGKLHKCINLGSYNYLGFASADPYCTPRVLECLKTTGWSASSARADAGTTSVHVKLEEELARYLGVEAALTFGMGYATNSANICALVGKGDLVVSDALNHASIVTGVRASGAKCVVFKHNNPAHLEGLLRTQIAEGQPRTRRPWRKILIIVEGIYSMEGEICRLKEIVELKNKYRAYLYLDEAHSIGALGATGRGACEATGVDPRDVDVMMGTFTKSFGSCGGYIAGRRDVVEHLAAASPAHVYATAMSPPAVEQVLSALELIQGRDGSKRGADKIAQLHHNANWMRRELKAMNMEVLGDDDAPVMPIMLYAPCKIAAFSRGMYDRGIATAVVGFPATPLLLGRARICVSAAHTKEDMLYSLNACREVRDEIMLEYKKRMDKTSLSTSGPASLVADPKQLISAH